MSTKNRESRESRFKKKIYDAEEKKEEKIAQEIKRQKTARQHIINKKRQEQQEQQEERYRQQQQQWREDEEHRNKIITESISHAINTWEQNLRNRSNQSRYFSFNPFFFKIENVAKDYYQQHRPNDTNIPTFNTSFLKQKKQRGELLEQRYRQRQQQEQQQKEIYRQQQQREQQQKERYRQQQTREDEEHRNKIIKESISHAINAWEQNLRNRSNQSRVSFFISPFFFDVKKVAIDYYKQRRPNDTNIPDFYIIDNIIEQRQQRQQQQRQQRQQQQQQQQQQQRPPSESRPSRLTTETGPRPENCPSFGRTPEDCIDKTHYKKQALLFHPNRNIGCPEDATIKFQDLANFTKCKKFVSTGHNLENQKSGGKKNKSKKQQKHNKTKKLIKK